MIDTRRDAKCVILEESFRWAFKFHREWKKDRNQVQYGKLI